VKGIVLAGGEGTRLIPLTRFISKQLLPVFDMPLINFPLYTLKDAGIREVLIITRPDQKYQFEEQLGDGKRMGLHLKFMTQDKPRGLSHGLSLAEEFADGGPVIMVLGDNIYEEDLAWVVRDFDAQLGENGKGAKVVLKAESNRERLKSFGIPKIGCEDKIEQIEEKPKEPLSSFIVTGIYMCDNRCFNFIRTLKPSERGELEITDLLNCYARERTLSYHITEEEWIDAGTTESLLKANMLRAKQLGRLQEVMDSLNLFLR